MIRLYGVSIGNGSFARVTAGMRGALERSGQLAGFVPLDRFDADASYDGHDAEIGVHVGPPPQTTLMRLVGWHQERWCLLPPNSSWVPPEMLEQLEKQVTGLLAPSKWAKDVLQRHCADLALNVQLWQHGVDASLTPSPQLHEQRAHDYACGRFSVAHLASTPRERKGTAELILGWIQAVRLKGLGPNPVLTLVVEDFQGKYEALVEMEAKGNSDILRTIVWSRPRQNMDLAVSRSFYQQHHVLAQPSRGEGFGLCPLEARACGVPVVATACTGHGDTMRPGDSGVIVVPSGADAPIDDGPGALAPSIRAADVAFALIRSHAEWEALHREALAAAPEISKRWSWDQVTAEWLARRRE